MSGKQETSADIIAEMRGARTEFPFVYLMGEPDTPEVVDPKTKEIKEPRKINIRRVTVKELADRFEAALKRECGNYAAMREALKATLDLFWDFHNANRSPQSNQAYAVIRKIKAALSAPPRNCDVGTAEEQQARHCAWCRKHGIDGDNKVNCAHPDMSCDLCTLRWAQMPYVEKEGGAE